MFFNVNKPDGKTVSHVLECTIITAEVGLRTLLRAEDPADGVEGGCGAKGPHEAGRTGASLYLLGEAFRPRTERTKPRVGAVGLGGVAGCVDMDLLASYCVIV